MQGFGRERRARPWAYAMGAVTLLVLSSMAKWASANPEGRPGKTRGGLANNFFRQTTGASSTAGEQVWGSAWASSSTLYRAA